MRPPVFLPYRPADGTAADQVTNGHRHTDVKI